MTARRPGLQIWPQAHKHSIWHILSGLYVYVMSFRTVGTIFYSWDTRTSPSPMLSGVCKFCQKILMYNAHKHYRHTKFEIEQKKLWRRYKREKSAHDYLQVLLFTKPQLLMGWFLFFISPCTNFCLTSNLSFHFCDHSSLPTVFQKSPYDKMVMVVEKTHRLCGTKKMVGRTPWV